MNKTKFLSVQLLSAALIVFSVVAAVVTIFYGWDMDESYTVLLAHEMGNGSRLLADRWDLHQTAAIGPALIAVLYERVTGGITGLAIAMRTIATLIGTAVGVYFYFSLKDIYGKLPALISAVFLINVTPRMLQNMEYGFLSVNCLIICCCILLKAWKDGKEGAYLKFAGAGFFYALSVLCFPTTVITVPLLFFILVFRMDFDLKMRIRYTFVFFGVCFIAAAAFIGYLLSFMSIQEILGVLQEMGKSGDHQKMFTAFLSGSKLITSIIRLLGMFAVSFIIYLFMKKYLSDKAGIWYVYAVIITLIVLLSNLTGLRPSGPLGLNERYIGLFILGVVFFGKETGKKYRELFWLFYIIGIGYLIGILAGSAAGLAENALYAEMSMAAVLLCASAHAESVEKEAVRRLYGFALILFVFGVIFAKAYFVRISGTGPANIFEATETLELPPVNGIRVNRTEYDEIMSRYETIKKYGDAGLLCMYIGDETIHNFWFSGKFTAPQYLGTTVPNEQWVDYYSSFGHELPDMIFVDRQRYPDIEAFYGTEFGGYVRELYSVDNADGDDELFVLTKEPL